MGILDKLLAETNDPDVPMESFREYEAWIGKQCTGTGINSGRKRTGALAVNSDEGYVLRTHQGEDLVVIPATIKLVQQEQTREGYLKYLIDQGTQCTAQGFYDNSRTYAGLLTYSINHNKYMIDRVWFVNSDTVKPREEW